MIFTWHSLLSLLLFHRSETQCEVTPIAKYNPNYTFNGQENEPNGPTEKCILSELYHLLLGPYISPLSCVGHSHVLGFQISYPFIPNTYSL